MLLSDDEDDEDEDVADVDVVADVGENVDADVDVDVVESAVVKKEVAYHLQYVVLNVREIDDIVTHFVSDTPFYNQLHDI